MGSVVGLCLALVLAGCSGDDAPVATGAGQAPSEPIEGEGLPVLPPVEQRQPELFDGGCLVTGPDEVDCSTTADQLDAADAGASVGDERSLEGFLGSWWIDGPTAGGPVVLAETVVGGPGPDGRWRAAGLARNEGPSTLGGVSVVATLVGADGAELGSAEATSPVSGARSGEPVPFEVVSDVDAAQVADVRWSAVGVEQPAAERGLELAIWWVRAAGDPRPVELYAYTDEGAARPQTLFASVVNRAERPIERPGVVLAWLAPTGEVLAVAEAPVLDPTGAPLGQLGAGAAADALVVIEGSSGDAGLADATPILWGVGG